MPGGRGEAASGLSRRHEAPHRRGQVTTSCLWTACRAMVLGLLMVAAGAAMATLGYYNQQPVRSEAFAPPAAESVSTVRRRTDGAAVGHYRHLSYFGSVIMGIGGFIVVASCVMTFEVRDSASKIVPARFRSQPPTATSSMSPAQRSSASQTLPWHLDPAATPLTRSVSAPCVRCPTPVVETHAPPPECSAAAGSGASRVRQAAAAVSVGRMFRKHSMNVLCALRAGAMRAPPPVTSSGDQSGYDNRLGRQCGHPAASLMSGSSPAQRCSPSGGYRAFNGIPPPAAAEVYGPLGVKHSISSDRRLSESALRSADVRARRRDVLVHIEHGSSRDELLTVSHLAPLLPSAVTEVDERQPPLSINHCGRRGKTEHTASPESHALETATSDAPPEAIPHTPFVNNKSRLCQNNPINVSSIRRFSESNGGNKACNASCNNNEATKTPGSALAPARRASSPQTGGGRLLSPMSSRPVHVPRCPLRPSLTVSTHVVVTVAEESVTPVGSVDCAGELRCSVGNIVREDLSDSVCVNMDVVNSVSQFSESGESDNRLCDVRRSDVKQDDLRGSGCEWRDLGTSDGRSGAREGPHHKPCAIGRSKDRVYDLMTSVSRPSGGCGSRPENGKRPESASPSVCPTRSEAAGGATQRQAPVPPVIRLCPGALQAQ